MLRQITKTTIILCSLAVAAGCGGAAKSVAQGRAAGATAASAGPGSPAVAATQPQELEEQLVIEAWLTVEVDDVQKAAAEMRRRVDDGGGRIVNEQLAGGATSWSGSMKMRLPPEQVTGFVGWLETLGDVTSKRVQGTDVSRQLFDQEIALENLTHTLTRLRSLLEREGLEMDDILAIEKEMTRLRGEIERIKGEQRYLRDRVAFATVEVTLERREGVILGPEAKFYPGARGAMLTLFSPGDRARNRFGGGLVIHTLSPGGKGSSGRFTLEVDLFEPTGDEDPAVLATMGGAVYSDFLGRGKRDFFNPYLGFRLGYGYLDGSAFAFAGTAGVELFKHEYVLLDLNVRALGLVGGEFNAGLVTSGSLVFAF